MSFAAVYIPEFPVAACLSNRPELKCRPLVLFNGKPPQEVVASLNGVAQASGISHGMSKVQAETVCSAHFRPRDEQEEAAAFQLVLEAAERFSPRVQSIAAPANGYAGEVRLAAALLIDRSGTGFLFGTAQSFAQRLHDELAAMGYGGTVATAPNCEAALLLARSHRGVVCVDQKGLQEGLAQLPALLLPCDAKTHAVLRRWGIRTLGELAALPVAGLISRLGQTGARLQQLARGEAPRLLVPQTPVFSLSQTLELDSPIDDLERLLFGLSRLLGEVLHKAVERAYAVRSVTATFGLDDARTHSVVIAPSAPTQNRDVLLKLLNLELQAHPPPSQVLAIRLEAVPAQPQIAQHGLFQSQFPDPGKLDLLLARLKAIAGEQNVGSPELSNSHREDSFAMVAFRPEHNCPGEELKQTARPAFRVCRPAQSVKVWLANDRPHTLFWHGTRLKIADAAGPWHMSGSWWDQNSFDRDYWDVVTEGPAYMLRLQQERPSQNWNVTGLYD